MKASLLLLTLLWINGESPATSGNLPVDKATTADGNFHIAGIRSKDSSKKISNNMQNRWNHPKDKFRRFVSSAVLRIPDYQAQQNTWAGPLYLNVTNFRCFDVTFGNTSISLNDEAADQFQIEVTDLKFKCDFGTSWSYDGYRGIGLASLASDKNYLTATMSAASGTWNERQICQDTAIGIGSLEYQGDMTTRAMDLYLAFVQQVAEHKLEEFFCHLLSQHVLELILNTKSLFRDMPVWRVDPLSREGSMATSGYESIINLQNDAQMSSIVTIVIENLNRLYGTRISDAAAPTPDGLDYRINTILREKLLETRIFKYYEGAGVTKTSSTCLVDTEVTLKNIKIHGLDTAVVVTPITVIGNYTVQSRLRWDALTIEVDLTIKVSASADFKNASIENGAHMEPIVESFTYLQSVTGLDIVASFFAPLERSLVGALPIGYILGWESHPACLPSVLSGLEVSGLDLTMADIQDPVLHGIESKNLNDLAENSIHMAMTTFKDDILAVLPALFQREARDAITQVLASGLCPAPLKLSKVPDAVGRKLLFEGEEFVEPGGEELYFNLIMVALCVTTAALAAGLTMGLLSLDELMLMIKQRAGATEKDRKAAECLLPIVRQHHLLLVSLLLMNAIANEALPLFLDKIVPPYLTIIISVTLVLFFGEIIPSALFTGPDQVKLASSLAPLVRIIMLLLSPIAYPISKVLDHLLHDEHDEGYNRKELSALVRIQYESHLADKRERKAKVTNALKELESMDFSDHGQNTAGPSLDPEVKRSIRSLKRKMSRGKKLERDLAPWTTEELHVDEVTMVQGALLMGTTQAIDVYTPWNSVFAVPKDMIFTERNTVGIYRSGFSRIPVYEKNPDDPKDTTRIVGILISKQLIVVDSHDKREVSTLPLTVPCCVAPHTTLVDLVNLFQSGGVRGSHMALVCGHPEAAANSLRRGKPIPEEAILMGVVTLEDVLEHLIQEEIYDEFDRKEKKHFQLAKWGFLRWKKYTQKRRQARREESSGTTFPPNTEPKMMEIVEEVMRQEETHPTERTSLLMRFNPFK